LSGPWATRAIGEDPHLSLSSYLQGGRRDWRWVLLGGPTAKTTNKDRTIKDKDKGAGPKPCAKAPTTGQSLATVHHGAAVAIGRRAYAYGLGAETPLRAKARERQALSA
jgi:hypothetical protein